MMTLAKSRALRKRNKKRRKRKVFIGIYAFLFLLIIGYSSYEYLAGKHQAMNKQASAAEDIEPEETVESIYEDEFKGKDNGDGKLMVLLLGVDQRGSEMARTDTIMLAEYDTEDQEAKVVSLMRDLYVDIPGHGYNKLNAAFALGGPELLRETIEINFGIHTEYYSIIDFNGFTQIVDTLSPDGVDIDVEKDMQYTSADKTTNIQLEKGPQTLDGKELLGYVRYRSDARGDFARVERQQKVIQLMKDELLSFQGVLKAPRLIGNIQPYIDTNIGGSLILQIGKNMILNPVESIDMLSIPTTDNVWDDRKPYPIGLVLNHDEIKTRQTLEEFFEKE
ncbi:cell envelope-related function transcriptional attenuator common domain-containing protein [Halobacillus karajensis]|uniref:Regulatory protein MsrR n=1 Tax=Halobacillus karajensis TaxID=195088 RepID=A0A024P7S9_9BACI|nr:Regulatory protein MsrR [Halobacillus karajensis]CDQ24903.1 Regulatory protein MsrR [Halobacillus karajensis]CDQ28737.1 Regulatory protein MsrR [Halobacillus karajensis]SEH97187.1 cell envelope-related function transcriptional attenuator common domain-containing protein [Halobacillus karajensis]